MARVLFVAHDPGGANMLRAVMPDVHSSGHECIGFGSGPAIAIWGNEPSLTLKETHDVTADELASLCPAMVITGTSFGSCLERQAWRGAREKSIRSLACIDSWSNFERRFTEPERGVFLPDGICVVDSQSHDDIASSPWWHGDIYVIGQPHLEAITQRVRAAREQSFRLNTQPLVTFFSEPVDQDYPNDESFLFNQFEIAEKFVDALAAISPAQFVVRPHPRENTRQWTVWAKHQSTPAGISISIGKEATETSLVKSSIVTGMTSMVLIEAALSGVSVISFQIQDDSAMSEKFATLPNMAVVRTHDDLEAALIDIIDRNSRRASEVLETAEIIHDSTARFMSVLNVELGLEPEGPHS